MLSKTWPEILDRRPIVVAVAGSNGAGKSTFYEAHLSQTELRYVNADDLASSLQLGAYEAAELANQIRRTLLERGESFIFETVFSDPVGDKIEFLQAAHDQGYAVALVFVEIPDVATSQERVSIRVAQGGHDVPDEKLELRFSRTRANLDRAIARLPLVFVFDNGDLKKPFRLDRVYVDGERAE
jgi:predicted ABC-type ATPase